VSRGLAAAALLVWLGGCAVQTLQRTPDQWLLRSQSLQSASSWEMSGRISVKTANDAMNGSLSWAQDGELTELSVRGPIGVGGFRLTGNQQQMLYQDSNGENRVIDQPERALPEQLGWDVPLGSLRYWVRALADPAMPAAEEFDDSGLLSRLEQQGWQVEFSRYGISGGLAMPGRITLLSGELRIRLAVSQWKLGIRP